MSGNLNEHLEQSSHGPLQTKPDERRRYLGSLRERVYLKMTITDSENPTSRRIFLNHTSKYRDYQTLIDGKVDQSEAIDQIEALCAKESVPLTLISNENTQTNPDLAAILVMAKSTINRNRIAIRQVCPPEFLEERLNQPREESFWHKLFHRGDTG